MAEITPAILEKDFSEVKNKLTFLCGRTKCVQIDFCDGIYVPHQTWPFTSGGFEDVDFLKIDIEGSELEVIEELSNAKKLRYVKQMVIEYHHHIARESDVFSRMLRLLEDAGFGYQIESFLGRPFAREQFQDIIVYVYRKKSTA